MAKEKRAKGHSVKLIHSIRTKMILTMILMAGLMIFVLCSASYALLSPYYEYSKISMLADTYGDAERVA